MNLDEAFDRNPKIGGGQTVFGGPRAPLRAVLASLADGDSFADFLKASPRWHPSSSARQ